MADRAIPSGYTSLTPFLVVEPAAAAVDFYVSVFGARVVQRMDGPDGTIAHAELDLGHGRLQLCDPSERYGLVAVTPGPTVTHSTVLCCADVDAVVARAVEAGASLREEVSTFVTGDRYGSIVDPFGQRWAVMTRVEDLTPAEVERRLAAWGAAEGVTG